MPTSVPAEDIVVENGEFQSFTLLGVEIQVKSDAVENVIPEPGTVALLALGLLGFGGLRLQRRTA